MRVLVLSDIHANLEALEAALEQCPYDQLWVLGDLVGYGADPDAVVDRIQALQPAYIIRGNHDKVCSGLETAEDFSPLARLSAEWTLQKLRPDVRGYLQSLPPGPVAVGDFLLCHGSPADEDEYLISSRQITPLIRELGLQVCLFGHTHVPMVYVCNQGRTHGLRVSDSRKLNLDRASRYFINPGSVGQPRDGDPRGSVILLDTESPELEFFKFRYEVGVAAEKIRRAGLPPALADRLYVGR